MYWLKQHSWFQGSTYAPVSWLYYSMTGTYWNTPPFIYFLKLVGIQTMWWLFPKTGRHSNKVVIIFYIWRKNQTLHYILISRTYFSRFGTAPVIGDRHMYIVDNRCIPVQRHSKWSTTVVSHYTEPIGALENRLVHLEVRYTRFCHQVTLFGISRGSA